MLIEQERLKEKMPDIASQEFTATENSKLNWVGMDRVEVPIRFDGLGTSALAGMFVNIADPKARGIHMSRLFLVFEEKLQGKEINWALLKDVTESFKESQKGLSDRSLLKLKWKQLMKRPALLSENEGWKGYPVRLEVKHQSKGQFKLSLNFSVFYSSTCPCSAALARQLRQKKFTETFTNENISVEAVEKWIRESQVASPHSQRSRADITMEFHSKQESLALEKYIDAIEAALKTPVQTAVKREDEQEFARLNGENLMFVEDALRRMKKVVDDFTEVKSYKIKAHHMESLHRHNAVGEVRG